MPEPDEFFFRLGIAYPTSATISGIGPGAERRCHFSTGDFVEPIEVWDEPHLLKFAVTENPPPMKELTIFDGVAPPHLHGFMNSQAGQFRLIALDDGSTLLEGTTWYRNDMAPIPYWQLWSDAILHRIHMRVLRHIKTLAETEVMTDARHND